MFFLTNLEFSSASEQRTTNFVNIMSQGAEEPNFNLCRNSIYIVALVSGSLSSLRLVLCYPIYLFMRRLKPSGYRFMFITRTQRVTLFVARRVTKGKRSFPKCRAETIMWRPQSVGLRETRYPAEKDYRDRSDVHAIQYT